MQAAEFVYFEDETAVKKFPSAKLPPAILAQSFRLVESSMNLLSNEGEYSSVATGAFNPVLSPTATKFVIYGERIGTDVAIPSQAPAAVTPNQLTTITAATVTALHRPISMRDTKDEISKIIRNTCDIRKSVQLLSSVPQTCLLLDSVQMLMACTQDMKLEVDTDEYSCLKKSTTFKAELFRCTTEIRDTFFNCGLAMNTMQSLTSELPTDFACLISVVANLQNPDLKMILDLSCHNIREASDELVKVSEDITAQIHHAQKHLEQLLLVAIEKEEENITEKDKTSKEILECKTRKKELTKIQNLSDEEYKIQRKHHDKVYADYASQLAKYQTPSLPETVFRLTGEALSNMNDAISSAVNNTASAAKTAIVNALPFSNDFTTSHEAREVSEKSLIALLTTIRNDVLENMEVLDESYQRHITFVKIHIRYTPCTKAGKETQKLAKSVLEFFDKIKENSDSLKPSELLLQEPLKTELNQLKARMDATLSIVKEVRKNETEKEEAKKKEKELYQKSKTQFNQRLDEAKKYALELAKTNYEKEEERAEQFRKKRNEDQQQIMEFATKMATLNLQTIELKDVIETLINAKAVLLCIQTSWTSILQFFKMVKANIDGQFNKNLVKLLMQTDLYIDHENRELLPIIVKTMMMTIGSCVQFGHCAEIYSEILSKHAMPVMNDMTNSMNLDKFEAQRRQQLLPLKLVDMKREIETLIKQRTRTSETKDIPKILENFAKTCYQTLAIDVQQEEPKQISVLNQVLNMLTVGLILPRAAICHLRNT